MAAGEDVYCTLLMNDAYLPGAAVLAHSLRDAGTKKKLACMVCMDTLRGTTITELKSLYDYVVPVDRIGNPQPANLYLMNRPDLLFAFTKINLWRLTQFRKIVYVDADIVALRAPDELFDLPDTFAAAPDVGWPDIFNTGVMVLSPHMGDYWALRTLAGSGDSFDGADQGLLNQYFEHKDWKRLSFTYNCTPSANYQYEPAYRHHKSKISMVHFIGEEKPWLKGRSGRGPPGAYQELLGRWWAVYDRHFRAPTTEYISGQYTPASKIVQSEVKGEAQNADYGYSSTGYPHTPASQTEASVITTEVPFTEPGEAAEKIDQGLVEPTPTVEQRRFSAPYADWDATRAPPPADARPEAANFPSQTYEFNADPTPFHPPTSYPEPPKDMWYEVPKQPSKQEQRPPPIFPWEERAIAKPTRIFVDDEPPPPAPSLTVSEKSVEETEKEEQTAPDTPKINVAAEEPWQTFSQVNKNAWDSVAGIDEYVRALTASQRNRGKVQVLSPTGEPPEPAMMFPEATPHRERRESLLLTDFPTAVERPSLPVTPAPIRRPSFWGEERDDQGHLPGAEGVPDQQDWDPNQKLEELRRNSLIGPSDLKLPPRKLSKRDMPASSAAIPEEALAQPHVPLTVVPEGEHAHVHFAGSEPQSQPEATTVPDKPTLSIPEFAGATSSEAEEDVLSPTERSQIEEL